MHEIIRFSNRHTHYGVSFIDIVNSSTTISHLSGRQADIIYATFLNTCAKIIRQNNGEVVKNVGDGLLYYFPDTDFGALSDFETVVECGQALLSARDEINTVLISEQLPEISFRISASYGPVSVAEDLDNEVEDLFGVTINTCAKINRYADENSMIIGNSLHEKLQATTKYSFTHVADHQINDTLIVPLYRVN
jgi:class 3 adenylate cyclase